MRVTAGVQFDVPLRRSRGDEQDGVGDQAALPACDEVACDVWRESCDV
jgi:hypothetical protein